MQKPRQRRSLCYSLGIAMLFASSAIAREVPLLAPSQGQLPTDIATDDMTKVSLVDQSELGGKGLRVERISGDSFGDRVAKVTDWKQFITLKFDAVNPEKSDVELILSVKHRRTTSYQTRVDMPFTLKPGKMPIKTDPARLARIRAAKMPAIIRPALFDTPEADAIVTALEILPPDNPFNQVIEDWPVHPNSDAIIGSIGPDKPMRYNPDMGYVLVPENQPKIDVRLTMYAGESDPGPYPVPDNVPIEGWPAYYTQFHTGPRVTLDDVQRDRLGKGGDRHAIVVDPTRRMLYEFGYMRKTDQGWEAGVASIFDLKTNKLRPVGWTSTDAAGLPIFPAVVRYDELERGMVEHAMRVTVRNTRRAFVAPATHFASRHENEEYPRMGERLRLKRGFDISEFSPAVQAILRGLKKYGMFVADNGIEWAISVTPDPRIPNMHEQLRKVPGAAFEVVVSPH